MAIRRAIKKWRCFLEGQHVFIETDHHPLEFLRKETDDAQLNRIWEALEGFDYTLRYKPGAANTNADVLSRMESYRHSAGEPLRSTATRATMTYRTSSGPSMWRIKQRRNCELSNGGSDVERRDRGERTWRGL